MTYPAAWAQPWMLWLALAAAGGCGGGDQEKLAPLDANEDVAVSLPADGPTAAPLVDGPRVDAAASLSDAQTDRGGGASDRDALSPDVPTDRPSDVAPADLARGDAADAPAAVRDGAMDSDASGDAADAGSDLPRGPAVLSIAPTAHNFGNVVVGGGVTQNFVVTNRGGATTGALVLSLTGAAAGDYAIATVGNTCSATMLAGGATCTAPVRLAPTTFGLKLAAVSVSGGGGVMATAQLIGAGIP